jgi:hypothetical protein
MARSCRFRRSPLRSLTGVSGRAADMLKLTRMTPEQTSRAKQNSKRLPVSELDSRLRSPTRRTRYASLCRSRPPVRPTYLPVCWCRNSPRISDSGSTLRIRSAPVAISGWATRRAPRHHDEFAPSQDPPTCSAERRSLGRSRRTRAKNTIPRHAGAYSVDHREVKTLRCQTTR